MWIQNYNILGNNIFLTALFAVMPILFLFWALAIKKMKGYLAIFFAWIITFIVAITVYRMPLLTAVSAAGFGAIQGMFPLVWLAFNAVFLYNLIVKSGNFETIKFSIASISNDRRVQAILIGFCFAAFLEGTTGPGVAVGIASAMLVGLGFPPLSAVVVCLIGNAIPGPYGPVGMPTIIMVSTALSDLPAALSLVSGSVGGILSFFALIIPALILIVMCGWKAAKEIFPLCLTAGICYAIPNFFISRYMGPELVSILSPLVSLFGVIVFNKLWKPASIWRFEGDTPLEPDSNSGRYSAAKIAYAWSPFVLVVLFMIVWSLPAFKEFSSALPIRINAGFWPALHGVVYRAAPIVPEPTVYTAYFNFDLLSAIGTALFIVAFLTTLIFRMKIKSFFQVYVSTLIQLKYAITIMILVISIAQLSNYSGISFTLGLAFAATGSLFMVFSPIIGFIGIFLTGSVTSSSALFGNMQRVSAETLGLNPLITITANMTGAAMGKLLSPQAIAIGAAAIGLTGQEGSILGKVMKYSFLLLAVLIVVLLILAYVFPWYFPPLE